MSTFTNTDTINTDHTTLAVPDEYTEYAKYYQDKDWNLEIITIKFQKLDKLYEQIDSCKKEIYQLKNRMFMTDIQIDNIKSQLEKLDETSEEYQQLIKEKDKLVGFNVITGKQISELNIQISKN